MFIIIFSGRISLLGFSKFEITKIKFLISSADFHTKVWAMGMVVRKFMELDFSIFTLTAKHTPYPWSRLNALAHNLPNRICL